MSTHTFIFDPRGIVDGTTTDETIVPGPLTLDSVYGKFVVVTTMLQIETGMTWYVVTYHDHIHSADEDYEHENEQVLLCAGEDPEDYSDMHINVALIYL